MINKHIIDDIIKIGLKEDISHIDITTDNLIPINQQAKAHIIAKESGIIAGLEVFKRVFEHVDNSVEIVFSKTDGDYVEAMTELAQIKGPARSLLKAERLALNLLQRMCGIATMSYEYSSMVKGLDVKIVDTRKTTPGLRALEKYAVRCGGCFNHRYNLSDAVMIKDNHIKAAGSITEAVCRIKGLVGHTVKIEVEVETIEQLELALNAGADIIMLDNMDINTMKKAVEICNGKAILEASGGITKQSLIDVARTGVDVISVGALTHSVKAMDISMRFL